MIILLFFYYYLVHSCFILKSLLHGNAQVFILVKVDVFTNKLKAKTYRTLHFPFKILNRLCVFMKHRTLNVVFMSVFTAWTGKPNSDYCWILIRSLPKLFQGLQTAPGPHFGHPWFTVETGQVEVFDHSHLKVLL